MAGLVAGAMLFVGVPIASAVETAPQSDSSETLRQSRASNNVVECKPGDQFEWGGESVLSADASVSTYSGKNMYVGLPPASEHTNAGNGKFQAGDRSYVAEIEGVTVVDNALTGNQGIRVGSVAWGSGHPAPSGKTALAVGRAADAVDWPFYLFGSNGTIGRFNSGISGTNWLAVNAVDGGTVTVSGESDDEKARAAALGNVNGVNYYKFQNTLKSMADGFQNTTPTSGVVYDNVNFGKVDVQQSIASEVVKWVQGNDLARYDAGKNDNGTYDENGDGISKIQSTVNGQTIWARYTKLKLHEGKVTFTGDGNAKNTLQVFSLDMSKVNEAMSKYGWTGVYYDFENIPEGASVLVNVKGADSKGDLTVNTGWQFGWNGTDVGQGYFNTETAKGFATASQSIMWNFEDDVDGSLVIHNGDKWAPFPDAMKDGVLKDYPESKNHGDSAATLPGSILAAHATELQDWVSTNGRLFSNGDLWLSEAYPYKDIRSDGDHGYGIGLGLEHHNFPWTGNAITSCPTSGGVEWSKTDTSGQALSGSAWKITKDEAGQDVAVDGIVDNGAHDADALPGSLQVTGLSAGTYYLIETKAPDGYALDSTARQFTVTSGGLAKVNNSKPIQNTRQTGAVAWNKTDTKNQVITSSPSTWHIQGAETKTNTIDVTVTDRFSDSDAKDDATYFDANTLPGEIRVENLPTGKYQLTETKAPDGYTKTDVTYEFTIEAGRDGSNPVGIRAEGASDTTDSVANTPKNVSIEWSKKNGLGLDGILLPGAEWTFTQTGASAGSAPFSCTVTDKGALGAVQGSCKDEDDTAGQFKITFTPNKVVTDIRHPLTYELVETKAPDGYQQVSKPYQVNVWFDKNRGTDGEWVFHWSDLSGEGPITIVNKRIPISALPLTGGRGTARSWILAGGGLALFIVVAGAVWHEWRKRREELLL
ncbi:SpaA isopeptide-forming pilin-related protein [Bifidobacterium felsineum]|uniref:SpaA-like prealbumin fold domain-containing protein n=1 Tax=Bifidobacterium felsineum TaxID=2045440 RepID=A0A2M9HLR8_9BIFI|nr:SpaA isopeptide-forming pilin-related protein [Bifidobacterium felsineum]PJM77752.1 hypothetical protein CSQ86_01425 [Bifidobacterium felsineum]